MNFKEIISIIEAKIGRVEIEMYRNVNKKLAYTSFDGDYMHYLQDMVTICLYNDYIPINPEATLGYYVSTTIHNGDKIPVMIDCMSSELMCDELWIFEPESGYTPEGVLAEILFWQQNRKGVIRKIPFFENEHAKYNSNQMKYMNVNQFILSESDINEIIKKTSKKNNDEISTKLFDKYDYNKQRAYVVANFMNYKHLDWARAYCYRNNMCPISPQNILPSYLYRNIFSNYERHYLEDRLSILNRVNKVIWFTDKSNIVYEIENLDYFSCAELVIAWKAGKEIEIIDWKDAGVPKYVHNAQWAITTDERIDN